MPPNHALQRTEAGGGVFCVFRVLRGQPLSLSLASLGDFAALYPMSPIQTIYDSSQIRRVVVFQREDGSFGFEEQRFSAEALERAWIPFGRYSLSRCDTAESALAEAHGRVAWLAASSAGPVA